MLRRFVVWREGFVPRPRGNRPPRGLKPNQLPKLDLDLLRVVDELSLGEWDVIQDGVLVFYTYQPPSTVAERIDAVAAQAGSDIKTLVTGELGADNRFLYSEALEEAQRRWVRDGLNEEWSRKDAAQG
ncbi:MAG: hypothetical protein AB7I38_07700 [Dehalococcoidia bacterium]